MDGCFVLQAALDRAPSNATLAERMAFALRHGGASVTVAAITNFAAFMIDANTTLPALSAFSIDAALAVIVGLVLQLTFFSAMLCLDARRLDACRADVLFCVILPSPAADGGDAGNSSSLADRITAWGAAAHSLLKAVLQKLGQMYASKPARVCVLLTWAALLSAGIVGTLRMRVHAETDAFVPKGEASARSCACACACVHDSLECCLSAHAHTLGHRISLPGTLHESLAVYRYCP